MIEELFVAGKDFLDNIQKTTGYRPRYISLSFNFKLFRSLLDEAIEKRLYHANDKDRHYCKHFTVKDSKRDVELFITIYD